MALTVSDAFKAAQGADVNLPAAEVQLVLGNYASAPGYGSTAAASGSDGSGNYPAAGAIDGDRTEINVGAASGADNDVGLSSWRSATAPSSTPQTLDVTFSQSRTFNRVKLYHLSGHGLKSFKFSYWNGAAYVDFASTIDLGVGTTFTSTHQLDTVDFPDVTSTKLRLTVYDTVVVSDAANVVEMEVYRLIDITSRVKGIAIKRQRNYKLVDPLAAMVQLQLNNDDRFFSPSHTPTAAESTAGFVNQELRPEMGVLVSLGFSNPVTETVQVFAGTVDRLAVRAAAREATLECRDGMKRLINKIEFTKLKTAADISSCMQYVLNRGNISNYEMSLDSTGINIDYFFVDGVDELTTIRDLVQAAADAAFFFDESGVATFKSYAGQTPLQHVFTSEGDWESGTLTALDTTSVPGELLYLFYQSQTWNDSTAGWTTILQAGGSFTSDGTGILLKNDGSIGSGGVAVYRPFSQTVGEWRTSFKESTTPAGSGRHFEFYFFAGTPPQSVGNMVANSAYFLSLQQLGSDFTVQLGRTNVSGSGSSSLGSATITGATSNATHAIIVRRSPVGYFQVYVDGNLLITATDTTYTFNAYVAYVLSSSSVQQVYWLNGTLDTPVTTDGVGTWVSPAVDTGVNTVTYGNLTSTSVLNSGTIAYYTRSSADGATWDPYILISVSGQIQSIVRRYLQVKAVMTLSNTSDSPAILDITVNWTTGTGSSKYPLSASFVFSFDSTLLDVEQGVADNLGGGTSLYNDVAVQAQPLVLTGANTDVRFQASVGTPPTNVSASTPLSVSNGQTVTVAPYISGGMDTSRMSGANPAALAVTFASSGAGSWVCTSIHPTRPVFAITITHDGTITNLQVQGKAFQAASYIQVQEATDAKSISLYANRKLNISNVWIVSAATALSIAQSLVANFKDPLSYLPACAVRPTFSAQVGDRVTVVDESTDLTADYQAVEVTHTYAVSGGSADVKTDMTLIKIPV